MKPNKRKSIKFQKSFPRQFNSRDTASQEFGCWPPINQFVNDVSPTKNKYSEESNKTTRKQPNTRNKSDSELGKVSYFNLPNSTEQMKLNIMRKRISGRDYKKSTEL